MGDTLKLVNRLITEKDRTFEFETSSNQYDVEENLGVMTDGKLSIIGVSSENGNEKSTVNLNGKTGFELNNNSELNISDTKLTGNETLISVGNGNAEIKLKDSYIDGNIIGSENYTVTIDGKKITTLDGRLENANTILTGGGLRFNTDTFADKTDKLTAAGGNIYLDDNNTSYYIVNELVSDESVKYSIDINLNGSNPAADKLIITNSSSSGTVLIDSINYINNTTPQGEFQVQILDKDISSSLGLALTEVLKKQEYIIGKDLNTWDDLTADISFNEKFHDFEQEITKYGSLQVVDGTTAKDSLALKDNGHIEFGEEVSTERKDTLKELNRYQANTDKNFNFMTSTDRYKVEENLGEATSGVLNINGYTSNETVKSTINLDGKSGFELNNASTINLNDTKLTGNETLISVGNKDAKINLKDSYIDGNITGTENYSVTINGGKTTTLNGKLTNAETTMTGGTLKFNTDTFADTSDRFNAKGGTIALNNGKIESYTINSLTSSEIAKYTIDVNLSDKAADTFNITEGSGIFTLDNLQITGNLSNPDGQYIIQILKNGADSTVELALSDSVKDQLSDEYIIGTRVETTYDTIESETNWQHIYEKYSQKFETLGKLDLTTKDTKNDSIGITVTGENVYEKESLGSMGDTLRLVNNTTDVLEKSFVFDTSKDEYKVSENLGKVTGSVSVKGISDKTGAFSSINMNGHSGFEVTEGSVLNVENTAIKNSTSEQGSVINGLESGGNIILTNVTLTGNRATGEHGGAIYSKSDVEINADNGKTIIKGNKTSSGDEAIYLDNAKLTLNSENNGSIEIADKINGDNYTTAITGDSSGNVYLTNKISNSNVTMDNITLHLSGADHFDSSNVVINSGTLNLVNGTVHKQIAKSFNVSGDFKVNVDVDLDKTVMDRLPENTTISNGAFINVDKINLLSDTYAKTVAIPFANEGFKDNVRYIGAEELSKDTQITAFAPIFKYSLQYENRDDLGYFVFTRGAGSSPSTAGAYNPAILTTPVSIQAGGYAAINETFNYAFRHSDIFQMLPKNQKFAMMHGNEYSISDTVSGVSVEIEGVKDRAIWVQPYANFESISLHNGPKVNVTSYGTLVGSDSELYKLSNGWNTVTTVYAGYNGSVQNYSGVSTTQNGGLLGATQTFYKSNFFTALTASAGASVGESHTMYGHDNYTMLLAGIASKSGYNIEFKDGKYILQPMMMMSYTFVNTFDYTNAKGIRIDSDPLHTIQLHPSLKFAANLKNGWQPYAQVGMVWNILNDTKVKANDITLPQMSVKPYVEYGLGLQKTWKDRFTGTIQAMVRNGGRNGITLSAGLRWSFGKEGRPAAEKAENDSRKIVKQLRSEKNTNGIQTTRTTHTGVLKRI